jgi:hypothetical protein
VVGHFRRMMKDLMIAADQVLYRIQMAKSQGKWKEAEGESA